jgi:hypothetical protein
LKKDYMIKNMIVIIAINVMVVMSNYQKLFCMLGGDGVV